MGHEEDDNDDDNETGKFNKARQEEKRKLNKKVAIDLI
jgi:hypothetical protein